MKSRVTPLQQQQDMSLNNRAPPSSQGSRQGPPTPNLPREEVIDANSALFQLPIFQASPSQLNSRQEVYVPQKEAVLLLKHMEDEAKQRIQHYRDFAYQLKDRYRVYEQEAGAHYERIAEDLRVKVRKQLAEQEEVCRGLRMKIDENNITITLLQMRLEEVQRAIEDREREAREKERRYERELEELRREASEEQMKVVAEVKLERGEMTSEKERWLQEMLEREEELERRLKEVREQAEREREEMLSGLEREKVEMQAKIERTQEEVERQREALKKESEEQLKGAREREEARAKEVEELRKRAESAQAQYAQVQIELEEAKKATVIQPASREIKDDAQRYQEEFIQGDLFNDSRSQINKSVISQDNKQVASPSISPIAMASNATPQPVSTGLADVKLPQEKVDINRYNQVKQQKQQNKQLIQIWYSEFERKNKRKPTDQEAAKEIKGLLDQRAQLIKEYTKMKAILLSQNALPAQGIKAFSPRSAPTSVIQEPIAEEAKVKSLAQGLKDLKSQKTQDKQKDEQAKGQPVDQPYAQQETNVERIIVKESLEEDQALIKQLKSQISELKSENTQLQTQLDKFQQLLKQSVGESEVIKSLQDELTRHKSLLTSRDSRVQELMASESQAVRVKEEIRKDLEEARKERDQEREAGRERDRELAQHKEKVREQERQIMEIEGKRPEMLMKVVEGIKNEEKAGKMLEKANQKPEEAKKEQSQAQVPKAEPEKIYITDESALKILKEQVETVKSQNSDLESQIKTLTETIERLKNDHRHEISALQTATQARLTEIQNLTIKLGVAQDLIKNLKDGQQNDASALQEQVQVYQTKLQKKKAKNSALKQAQSQLVKEREDAAIAKKYELEQLQQSFKYQITLLENEIGQYKNDIEELKKNKEGAMTDITKQFNSQIEQLTAKYQAEIKVKESEVDVKTKKVKQLDDQIQALTTELGSLKAHLQEKNSSGAKLEAKVKELELAVGDTLKMKSDLDDLKKENEKAKNDCEILSTKFKEEQKKRKELHNQLEDMKGAIRLFCRIRPLSQTELEREESRHNVIQIIDEFTVTFMGKQPNKYVFDSVFDPDSTQEQVFEETKRLIQSSIDGFNVCIFAYGQTGSGKTHTVQGTAQAPGITPRAIHEMFGIVGSMSNYSVELSCYMVELYKMDLRDLLLPKGAQAVKLDIKENAANGMVYLPGVTEKKISSIEEAINIFQYGLEHRMTRATKMNSASSRSHLIFSIIIIAVNKQTKVRTAGKLTFVDLAGSEKAGKTGTDKEGAAEGRAINQSLSALGNVISALSQGHDHIPYRDHPLTQVMKDSLGGTAKTLMFVNVSPSVYNESESKNSMDYATRVKKIKNKVTKNVETINAALLKKTISDQDIVIQKLKEVIQKSNMSAELILLEPLLGTVNAGLGTSGSSAMIKRSVEEEKDDEY